MISKTTVKKTVMNTDTDLLNFSSNLLPMNPASIALTRNGKKLYKWK